MSRPKLYLRKVETLRGNVAREWLGTCGASRRTVAPERRAGTLEPGESRRHRSGAKVWAWLAGLARLTPSGRAGW